MSSRLDNVRSWIDAWVEGGSYPGALIGVYDKEGKELLFHNKTNTDENESDAYHRNSIFRIFSMTKPITAVAAMILVDRGLLSIDDPVAKWIPAFAESVVCTGGTVDEPTTEPMCTPITVYHLLTHTSGIGYGLSNENIGDQLLLKCLGCSLFETINMELSDLCTRTAKAPLNFQPGTAFMYGLNLDILGYIIELISGVTLDLFFQKEIFEPLGMVDTDFYVPQDKIHRLVPCYEVEAGHRYKVSRNPLVKKDTKPICLQGGGGLVSTMKDFSRFALCLLNKGQLEGKRIISEERIAWMTSNQLPDGKDMSDLMTAKGFLEFLGGGFGFGGAMSMVTDVKKAQGAALSGLGEYGWGGLASTFFTVDPVKGFLIVFLTQLIPSTVYPTRGQLRWIVHWALDSNVDNQK